MTVKQWGELTTKRRAEILHSCGFMAKYKHEPWSTLPTEIQTALIQVTA